MAKFNPSHGVNFWVRCASGNVSFPKPASYMIVKSHLVFSLVQSYCKPSSYMIVESYLVFSCAGENPGCDPLYHGDRTVSLYGGFAGERIICSKF